MIYVWRAVQSLGRATPEDVTRKVALQMGADPSDKNLKRSIYRDLKDFADSGDLHVEGFTPDGLKIETGHEDEHKNLRIEYYIPGDEAHVPGGKLLLNGGYQFIPQKGNFINWSVSELDGGLIKEHMHFIFSTPANLFLSLNIPVEELPGKILVARKPTQMSDVPDSKTIEAKLGVRAAVLLTPDKTVSRSVKDGRIGHSVVEFVSSSQLKVQDMGSSAGTFVRKVTQELLQQLLDKNTEEYTQSMHANPFDLGATWKIVGVEPMEIELPTLVRFGDFVGLFASAHP